MRAIPRATPTTIPATVPLESRLLGDGTGAPEVAFVVELLLVLLELWVTGVEVSLLVGPGVGITEDAELMEIPLGAGLGAADVRGFDGPLAKLEGAELEAKIEVDVLPPGAVGSEIAGVVGEPSGAKYIIGEVAVGTPATLFKGAESGGRIE